MAITKLPSKSAFGAKSAKGPRSVRPQRRKQTASEKRRQAVGEIGAFIDLFDKAKTGIIDPLAGAIESGVRKAEADEKFDAAEKALVDATVEEAA